MFLKVMGIDSICSKLLKKVGLLAVRLDLAKNTMIPLIKNAKTGQNVHFLNVMGIRWSSSCTP